MNIHSFIREINNLTDERRTAGLQNLFNEILRDQEGYENLILDILDLAELAEENDYFGTEGLDI